MDTDSSAPGGRGDRPASVVGARSFVVSVAAAVTALGLLTTGAAGQDGEESVQSPSDFHGYPLGTRYTVTSAHYDYYEYLAGASPRVTYESYGTSIQGRELPLVLVSSEENLERRGQIKENLRTLTDRTEPLPEQELERIVSETPGVVWLFIVDTDEEAGVEVLQEVAHELATREDAGARAVRDSLMVVLTPMTNPDSHARYVTWHKIYNVAGASTDPNAIENDAHFAANTDGNAWGVDVNRDFGWFVTPEMQALAREATAWNPQIWLDIHSGPDVIFIPPFPRPYHPLWPEAAPRWWNLLGERAGERFGERGWTFNSRKDYEGVTSVGFALSWGMLGPAVSGMLYESFGGRPDKTLAFRRDDGTVATLREAMDYHALGIWSLLEVATENRTQLLRDAHRTVIEGVEEARARDVRGVVLPAEGDRVDPSKLERLVERLTLQGIDVRRASSSFRARTRDFVEPGSDPADRQFPAGTYYVDFDQPEARLARTVLDPTIDYSDPEVDVPFDSGMPYYDVTWSALPLLFGVPAYTVHEDLQVDAKQVTDAPGPRSQVNELPRDAPPYAYLLPAGEEATYRTVVEMALQDFEFRVATGEFRIGEETYPKGTFAALAERNPDGLGARLKEVAGKEGADVVEVASPYTDAGTTFGNEVRLRPVEKPLVAVVADEPVAHDHIYGGIRSTLEGGFDFPFSPVMLETVNRADLDKYTAVVLPHAGMSIRAGPGFGEGYGDELDTDNLRRYVRGGGTLVAVKGAAAEIATDSVLGAGVAFEGWSAEMNGAALAARWRRGVDDTEEPVPWSRDLDDVGHPVIASGVLTERFVAPGAYPVLLSTPEGSDARVLASYADESVVLDGFATPEARSEVSGRPLVVVNPVGDGRVVYFADDPTFRGHWYGLNLLFVNTLLFGSIL